MAVDFKTIDKLFNSYSGICEYQHVKPEISTKRLESAMQSADRLIMDASDPAFGFAIRSVN